MEDKREKWEVGDGEMGGWRKKWEMGKNYGDWSDTTLISLLFCALHCRVRTQLHNMEIVYRNDMVSNSVAYYR